MFGLDSSLASVFSYQFVGGFDFFSVFCYLYEYIEKIVSVKNQQSSFRHKCPVKAYREKLASTVVISLAICLCYCLHCELFT